VLRSAGRRRAEVLVLREDFGGARLPALSMRPKVDQPARPLPSCMSHGHTACGGAAMVRASLASKSGAAITKTF